MQKVTAGRGCLAFAGAAAAVALICGCASNSGGSSARSAYEGTVPSTPASTVPGSPSGSSPSAATLADQVNAWVSSYGQAAITQLNTDLTQVTADIDEGKTASAEVACAKVATDVTSAQAEPPDPDSQQEQAWFKALEDLQYSAQACTNGLGAGDTSLVKESGTYMSMAQSELATLQSEIKSLYSA